MYWVLNYSHGLLDQIEEMNDADVIYANPQKEYTKKLIHAIPKGL